MERISFHDQISRNKRNSFFLIVAIFLVFIIVGYLISLASSPGNFFLIMIIAIIFSLVYLVGGYYNSHKIALSSVNAKPASKTKHKMFFDVVENMSIASGLPMPKLYVMESSQINAFASGRDPNHAVICVTAGTLEKLDKDEFEGVIAHEMSHIANYDIRFMTLTAVLVGMIAIISQVFLRSLWFSSGRKSDKSQVIILVISIIAAILAPLLVHLVSLAISRRREFGADATAVKLMRSPTGLKKALNKIKNESVSQNESKKYSKATAPLFISDPFKKKISGAFSTHPPIEKRIEVLERM